MTQNQFISSRFLLWDNPKAYPNYDLVHRDTNGPVFDLGVVLDSYDGSVYIHQDDIIEMARTIGMATADEVEALHDTIDELRRRLNRLPKAEEDLRNGLDSAVSQFYRDLSSEQPILVPDSETPVETEPESDGTFKR
jgi:hypothetical protein